jgi:integrase
VEASSDPPTRPTADAPFKLWAASYIAWKARKVTGPYSEKVRNQFRSFVPAWFAEMPVTEITPDHIADVLNADHPKTKQQLWQGRNSVADRLLIQIRGVLKYADIEPNPGAWERIESRVPQIERPDERQPSLPYKALPSFYARLMQDKRPVARFIQFVILTGLRRDEARLATWREVDLYERSLTIPAQRLKVKKLGDHIVPLGQAALDLLGPEGKKTDLLFPGVHAHSAQRFLEIAQEPSDVPGRFAVLHGMRSTFATWAQFHRFPEPVIQRAIAHKERNQSKGAYLRDNLLDHRRELHEAWSAYATSASGR